MVVGCETIELPQGKYYFKIRKEVYSADSSLSNFKDSLIKYKCDNPEKFNQYRDSANMYMTISYTLKQK